jgi:nitroreductase
LEALKAIKERRSVRDFDEQGIPKGVIEDIIDCGRLATTANNIQPWEFIVILDKDRRKKIAEMAPNGGFIGHAPVCIAVFCRDTKYYLEDGAAATENILIAARAYDLGTCWVAGDKKPYASSMNNLLDVPSDFKLVSLIALGYPKKEIKPCEKRPLKNVLHWEKYQK